MFQTDSPWRRKPGLHSCCSPDWGDASGFTILLHSLSKNYHLPAAGAAITQVIFLEANTLLFLLDLALLPASPAVCPPRCQQQAMLPDATNFLGSILLKKIAPRRNDILAVTALHRRPGVAHSLN